MARASAPALLVGSVPLATVEDVFRASAEQLGNLVQAFPDGEVGDRLTWVGYVATRGLRNYEGFEQLTGPTEGPLRQPTPDMSREERGALNPSYRVRPGADLSAPGDLEYAQPAIDSYAVFCGLRDEGVIGENQRFQVALPSAGSALRVFFTDAADWPAAYDWYERSVAAEIAKITAVVPPEDLVIQWDIAHELRDVYIGAKRQIPWAPEVSLEEKWDTHIADFSRLPGLVPDETALGYHLCFGTWGGWPAAVGVEDLEPCVRMTNELLRTAGREVSYVHIPVLPDADEKFVAPLGGLTDQTRIYLGLAFDDGLEGSERRIDLIRPVLSDFGVAWYCGIGRIAEDDITAALRIIRESALAVAR